MQTMQYCLRPIDENNSLTHHYLNTRNQNWTFNDLRRLNVTAQELILWSASIDLAERYQHFVSQKRISFAPNEVFFNCTKPWFGSQCQYSFELSESISMSDVVKANFEAKQNYQAPYTVMNLTCYIHLRCDRGGAFMCLDWREVCNGRVDCLDGGEDEAQCFDLEVNECGENEYRCLNGLCISVEFWASVDDRVDCLDQSDTNTFNFRSDLCMTEPAFICEEHSCRPDSVEFEFACGDGQCVQNFDACWNGRHLLMIESMSEQGNLSYDCWMAMICVTKIKYRVDRTSCEQFSNSSDLIVSLDTCESFTQFPIIPVLRDHVRFLYLNNNTRDVDIETARTPDYVCYDEQLCDFLTPSFRNGNNTCRLGHEMGFGPDVKHYNWKSMIDSMKPYFRGCLAKPKKKDDLEHTSLYCCKNSSKCISKHRILDGISDCYMNDDEEQFELSCSMNNTHRFKCPDEGKCLSPSLSRSRCSSYEQHNPTLDDISFHEICDRIVHLLPEIIDNRNHTDETECEYWQCSNIYTRCDLHRSCPNGVDEENCTQFVCPPRSHVCVSPHNHTLTCLSAERIGNGIIDCLGASDEPLHCRTVMRTYPKERLRFRCFNSTQCMGPYDLCNTQGECPFNDDEAFCGDRKRVCYIDQPANRSDLDDAVCRIFNSAEIYFSLKTTPNYPPSENRMMDHIGEWPVERDIIANNIESRPGDPIWAWRCNRGLYARVWLGNNKYKCFCPPSYYGDFCQYQNQRVSLTLNLTTVDPRGIYAIFVTLRDDDDSRQEVNSYNQFVSIRGEICWMIVNNYLLYSRRPKNISKNYSVRIDAFDKTSLTYVASWHLTVPFVFLPVNRLAAKLIVPAYRAPNPNGCTLLCYNGECMKYTNIDKFFCRCMTGWEGAQCHISINCTDCSLDSICVGSIQNRSICVCPLTKFGPRCLLTYSCPPNFCENNGRCVVIDETKVQQSYVCICSEQFYGLRCKYSRPKTEISLNNIEISSYLTVHLISAYEFRQPTQVVMLQKLTTLQRSVTIYMRDRGFRMMFIEIDESFYLAYLQPFPQNNIVTSISPAQRCASIKEVLDSKIVALPRIRRVKYYHMPCQTHPDLFCFLDEFYMCLCTLEHHANCFKFDHKINLACRYNTYCENGAECLQDRATCWLNTICICRDCFFGDRCQFYAKGIGLTLDDILRYEIRPNMTLADQSLSVKMSATLTMVMFVAGLINSVLSFLTFYSKDSRNVGCGMYLLTSSITSLLTVTTCVIKFWFLLLTQIGVSISRPVLRGGCVSIEPVLKLFLYMDNWLNACVAIERAITVAKGINFNKTKSKHIARWTIIFLPFLIMGTIFHEPLYRELFEDNEEQRVWCVTRYPPSVQDYNTVILFFHFLAPFSTNLFSALFIIFKAARQRAVARTKQSYKEHLREQLREHKQIVISPVALVVLSLPRLIISLLSDCVRASRNPWLYLSGYFISFIPSVLVFSVFVLPSEFYKKQFKESVRNWRRRISRE